MLRVFSVPAERHRTRGVKAPRRSFTNRSGRECRPGSDRWAAFLMGISALFGLAGCHAPTPSFNLLAPYGSPTVPPPPTGAVGTSPDYYGAPKSSPGAEEGGAGIRSNADPNPAGSVGSGSQTTPNAPSTRPGTSSGSGSSGSGTRLQMGAPAGGFMGTENRAGSAEDDGDRGVKPASYIAGTPSRGARFTDHQRSTASSNLKLNGMPVNDATSHAQPATVPDGEPMSLRELPDAAPASSSLRTLTPGAAYASTHHGAGTPTLATPGGRGSWQTR